MTLSPIRHILILVSLLAVIFLYLIWHPEHARLAQPFLSFLLTLGNFPPLLFLSQLLALPLQQQHRPLYTTPQFLPLLLPEVLQEL